MTPAEQALIDAVMGVREAHQSPGYYQRTWWGTGAGSATGDWRCITDAARALEAERLEPATANPLLPLMQNFVSTIRSYYAHPSISAGPDEDGQVRIQISSSQTSLVRNNAWSAIGALYLALRPIIEGQQASAAAQVEEEARH